MDQIEVLLASYNGAKYIAQQLDSILDQTVPGIRILISDDGSTDGTAEILEDYRERYPDRIRLLPRDRSGEQKGRKTGLPPAAGNFFWLLSQAEGDYLLFCDQDDVWRPQKAERMLGKMKEAERRWSRKMPLLVYSDMEVADEKLRRLSPSFYAYSHLKPGRSSLPEILVENPVTGGAMMINRALAACATPAPSACVMHDWWLALCAACFGRMIFLPEPLSLYRQHGDNTLGAKRIGSLGELRQRLGRQKEVEENYRRMFAQARAFLNRYRRDLTPARRAVLQEFLKLPGRPPAGRFRSIVKYRFYKSSVIQTVAQCLTIPRAGDGGRPGKGTNGK